ncbi:uncharacterized protein LOC132198471 [Neocloeon triangulifer]|uniref:uncharacterized protein LOC132198471 n=1 Tax=Neocloeon triangulifer TaxID=2078957 RepID=UPI00286F8185|nr:uncharacterized protein LOC132198471 [Neocloeon triangulifer]
MIGTSLHEFECARLMTNAFLAVVLVGRSFLALPLLPVFLRYLGLTALEAGLVCAAQALVEMLLTPVWLLAVRRSGLRRRALIVLGLVLAAALHVCLVFVPPSGTPQDVTHCLANSNATIPPPVNGVMVRAATEAATSSRPPTYKTFVPKRPLTSKATPVSATETARTLPTSTTPTIIPFVDTTPYSVPASENQQPLYEDDYGGGQQSYPMPAIQDPQTKRRPPIYDYHYADYAAEPDSSWRGRRLASVVAVPHLPTSPVFRAAFVLCCLAAALACLAEPAVAALWRQRLDDAEHLEFSGEHVAWGRLLGAICLAILAGAMAWGAPCFVARGLHQEVLHPLASAGSYGVAAFLALVLLPLPPGKLAAPIKRTAPAAPLRLVARGLAAGLAGLAFGSGVTFMLWHVAELEGFSFNYELLFGGFMAAEGLVALPVLSWARAAPNPVGASIGLLVLALEFGLAPLLITPTPAPLLGVLQGAGGALLERSLGSGFGSSSWRLGLAIGTAASGACFHFVGARPTLWSAAVAAVVAALAVIIAGRTPPVKHRRRTYNQLLLSDTLEVLKPENSDSEEGETDWLERALREEGPSGAPVS